MEKRTVAGIWKVGVGKTRRSTSSKAASILSGYAAVPYGQSSPSFHRPGLKPKAPLRVLVVEDAGEIRDAAADVLTRRGMVVRKASRLDNLIQNLHRFKPDVVVLDDYFRQSKVGFAELMPTLVERFPGIRYVITLSGTPTKDAETDPLRWGASDVVRKDTMFRDRILERSVINAARG
ncbi:response regulator [Methylobacterium sp. Leaf85]|uniref:response regulator n=1 Tax=Methylobacterium sp. Leaf85 TaxID=1736241 RepID=UPI0006F3DF38|nr:response regulator [Methylobacterium sp. Leaf85]KQO42527.1 hypothetical protein ASF08_13095 [Methylobacterium sp. Leaf85]